MWVPHFVEAQGSSPPSKSGSEYYILLVPYIVFAFVPNFFLNYVYNNMFITNVYINTEAQLAHVVIPSK